MVAAQAGVPHWQFPSGAFDNGNLVGMATFIRDLEKLVRIEINAPAVAFDDMLLRLCHCLLGRPFRPEPVAAFRERRVPLPLQNLNHRLLDKSSQHRRDAQLATRRWAARYYRPATHEDGGRRDENRWICPISIDYFVINASLPR